MPLTRDQFARAESLYFEATQLPAARWSAFLEEKCSDDAAVRAEVQSLLNLYKPSLIVHPLQKAMNEALHGTPDPSRTRPLLEPVAPDVVGQSIGPYRIEEQIGQGGMGLVFRAEQEKPVRRTVALKLIRAGMDSKDVVARFESERQALAMMDHPNVARVYDAGTTSDGRHYFVMEYVANARPITSWCDANRATIEQRIELFTDVCDAVQHAHQRGVIHRDLKPSNILVSEEGSISGRAATGVVKVIDFGVAKAVEQPLTAHLNVTTVGQLIGTPEYMSPEQANLATHDVDTRTDIYALGVVLYELVTGSPPLQRSQMRDQGLDQLLRAVREIDPPRPSTRVDRIDDEAAAREVADKRQTAPTRLARQLRGELDWIICKALEKDRKRRYSSAAELAEDLRRCLANEPVLAGPPSTLYRVRKFVRRHRVPVTAAMLLALVIVAGAIGTTWQAFRATRAEHAAKRHFDDTRKLAEALLFDLDASLRTEGPTRTRRRIVATATKYLDSLSADRNSDLTLRRELVRGYMHLGRTQYSRQMEGGGGGSLGDIPAAIVSYRQAVALARSVAAEDPTGKARVDVAQALVYLGDAQAESEDFAGALGSYVEAQQILASLVANYPDNAALGRALAHTHQQRGDLLRTEGRIAEATAAFNDALKVQQALLARDPGEEKYKLDVASTKVILAELAGDTRVHDDNLEHIASMMPIVRSMLAKDPESPRRQRDVAFGLRIASELKLKRGQIDEAMRDLGEAVALQEKILRSDPENVIVQDEMAKVLAQYGTTAHRAGKTSEAIVALERALTMRRKLADSEGESAGRRKVAEVLSELVAPYRQAGRSDDAIAAAREAVELYEQRLTIHADPANREPLVRALDLLADTCAAAGRTQEADAARRRRAQLSPITPAAATTQPS
jgi:serine/threonine protein kinase/tetratricopeptide (TPR) repeat protein